MTNVEFLLNILLGIITFIFLPLFVIILYDFWTFRKFFINLCNEIDKNFERISKEAIEKEFSQMRKQLEITINGGGMWIGFNKHILAWILALKTDINPTDIYRYLPSNEFRNFITRGYYNYIKEIDEPLTLFYHNCDRVSIVTQRIEADIINYNAAFLDLPPQGKRDKLEDIILKLRGCFERVRKDIEEKYREIHPFFKSDLIHIGKIYMSNNFKNNNVTILSTILKYSIWVIWFIIAIVIALFIASNPTITYSTQQPLVQGLSEICITISSIFLATILAYIAIIITRMPPETGI
jgi:hypothetical protein